MLNYGLVRRIRLYLPNLNIKTAYRLLKAIIALLFVVLITEQQIVPSELVLGEEIELSEMLEQEIEEDDLDLYQLFLSWGSPFVKEHCFTFFTHTEQSSFWEDVHLNRHSPPPEI